MMASTQKLCLLVLLGTFCVKGEVTIELDLSKDEVHIGENVTLTCVVQQDPESRVPLMFKTFKRYGSTEYEIALNTFVDPTFKDTGRYNQLLQLVNTSSDSPKKVIFTLEITNVQPSDSGVLGCALPSSNIAVHKKLVVYSSIEEVTLTIGDPGGDEFKHRADGQTLQFPEGQIQTVMCRVRGGYPAPKVVMAVKDLYITDQFNLKQDMVTEAGEEPGLQALKYRTSLLNETFNITYSLHNKMLKCSATIPGSGFREVSEWFKIQLTQYKPEINCGAYRPPATIGKPYFATCVLDALPPTSNINFFWEKNDNKREHSHVKMKADAVNDERTKITLEIDKITEKHLRDYILEAQNELGTTRYVFTLHARKGKREKIASAAPNWMISPYFVLLSVTIATKLIGQ